MIEFTEVPQPGRVALEWFGDLQPYLIDNYLIKGVISIGSMSVIYGPSNSGKTFFALDLAYRVSAGVYWNGRRVKKAAVLYLAAEGGSGIVNRVVALREEHRKADVYAPDVPLAIRRGPIAILGAKGEGDDVSQIIEYASEVRAKSGIDPDESGVVPLLIVIDTLSRAFAGGDENSSVDMTRFVSNVDEVRNATGAHVMIVHHTGKDIAKGARGHSSLRAATDTEIEVEALSGGGHAANVRKQRDYGGGETFGFSLVQVSLGKDQDGDDRVTCVVGPPEGEVESDERKGKGRPSTPRDAIDAAMEEIILTVDMAQREGRPITAKILQQMQFSVGRNAVRELIKKAYEDGTLIKIGERHGGIVLGVPQ